MSIKEQALRLIGTFPTTAPGTTFSGPCRAAHRGDAAAWVVRELRAPYGEQPETEPREEAGVSYDFDVIVERDADGWYVGSVPALQGCHTQARSVEQLMERVREAVELCLEVSGGRPSETGFVGIRRVAEA